MQKLPGFDGGDGDLSDVGTTEVTEVVAYVVRSRGVGREDFAASPSSRSGYTPIDIRS